MMNLLFIAPEFPPIQAAGAFRALRFVRHLPNHGIRPIVVCYNPAQLTSTVYPVNPDLLDKVPADTKVFYLDMSTTEKEVLPWAGSQTDFSERISHSNSFAELFDRIGKSFKIDAIFATVPPFSIDRLVMAAASHFQSPLLLDMRDAWTQWGTAPFRSWFHYRLTLQRETRLLDSARAVTSVTPQLTEMERKIGRSPKTTFHWIPNAHDQTKIDAAVLRLPPGKSKCRITYVGQFYFGKLTYETADGVLPWYRRSPQRWLYYRPTQQRWIYRSPYFFFRAWAALRLNYPDLKDRFEFHYVGSLPEWLPGMAEQFGLADYCTWHGFRSKAETRVLLENTDLALSTSIKVIDGDDYCLASKSFDYIVAGKPILGFVCKGAQRSFLESANAALLFDPDDTQANAEKLRSLLVDGFETEINAEFLRLFSEEETSKQLARVLQTMVTQQ